MEYTGEHQSVPHDWVTWSTFSECWMSSSSESFPALSSQSHQKNEDQSKGVTVTMVTFSSTLSTESVENIWMSKIRIKSEIQSNVEEISWVWVFVSLVKMWFQLGWWGFDAHVYWDSGRLQDWVTAFIKFSFILIPALIFINLPSTQKQGQRLKVRLKQSKGNIWKNPN